MFYHLILKINYMKQMTRPLIFKYKETGFKKLSGLPDVINRW